MISDSPVATDAAVASTSHDPQIDPNLLPVEDMSQSPKTNGTSNDDHDPLLIPNVSCYSVWCVVG